MGSERVAFDKEERKLLYRAFKKASTGAGLTFDAAMELALPGESFGIGYEDNFRAGKIARRKAVRIFNWLKAFIPQEAIAFDAEIRKVYGARGYERWEDFIEARGEFGSVVLATEPPVAPAASEIIVSMTREDSKELDRVTVTHELNRPFHFYLKRHGLHQREYVIGFQWVSGDWYFLRLGKLGGGCVLSQSVTQLPSGEGDGPLEERHLRETSHAGLHRLVFLVMPDDQTPTSAFNREGPVSPTAFGNFLDFLTRTGGIEDVAVLRLNAMFVAS